MERGIITRLESRRLLADRDLARPNNERYRIRGSCAARNGPLTAFDKTRQLKPRQATANELSCLGNTFTNAFQLLTVFEL